MEQTILKHDPEYSQYNQHVKSGIYWLAGRPSITIAAYSKMAGGNTVEDLLFPYINGIK